MKRFAVALVLSGCGAPLPEQVDPSAADAADDATDAGDPFFADATPAQPFHCPPAAPTEGTACSRGFGACAQSDPCEYGGAARPKCNERFDCIDGTWRRYGPTSLCTSDGGSPCPAWGLGDQGSCTGTASCSLPDGNCACNGGHWECHAASPSCPPSRPPGGSECGDASTARCFYPELYCAWLECGTCGRWYERPFYCPN